MKIRTGDKVVVTSGKDKGTIAEVLKVIRDKNAVIVKGVNIVTRHVKKQGTTAGQKLQFEKSIDASNVMIICPFTDKPTRIGYVVIEEKGKSKKFRFSKVAVKNGAKKDAKDAIIK